MLPLRGPPVCGQHPAVPLQTYFWEQTCTRVCQAGRLRSPSGNAGSFLQRQEDGEAGVYQVSTVGHAGAFSGGVSSSDTLRV